MAMISKALINFWSKFQIQIPWYSFTRDKSFLLTLSQSPHKNPSSRVSRHISNSFSVYLFLNSEL